MGCEAVSYLLATYTTGDVIAETDAYLMPFTEQLSESPTEYGKALWDKALKCYRACYGYVFKGTCIECLSKSIGNSMHSYFGSNTSAAVHYLVRYVTSSTWLQTIWRRTNAPCHNEKTDNQRGNTGRKDGNLKKLILILPRR